MMMMIVQNFFWCFCELIDAWQGLLAACWATTVLCTFTQCRFHAWCHFTENSNKCGIREWWQPVLVPSRKPKQIRKPKHLLILVCFERIWMTIMSCKFCHRLILACPGGSHIPPEWPPIQGELAFCPQLFLLLIAHMPENCICYFTVLGVFTVYCFVLLPLIYTAYFFLLWMYIRLYSP